MFMSLYIDVITQWHHNII